MRTLLLFVTSLSAFAQNYSTYSGSINAHESFLRHQFGAAVTGNPFRDSSLQAWFPLDNNTIGSFYDASGHNVLANPSGPSWYFGFGKTASTADYFNAAAPGNFIQVPSITITSPFTISVWVWPKQVAWAASYNRILEAPLYSSGIYLGTNSAGTTYEGLINASSTPTCLVGGSLVATTWQFITMTYDGTNANLYLNGTLVAGPCGFTWPGTLSGVSMRIGCQNVGTTCATAAGSWKGEENDVRIYNRVLPLAEIQALYAATNH